MAGLTLKNISKQFNDSNRAAVHNINLQIDHDEFLVLLGPSGCGKSTLLRIISGLVKPTEGQIFIDDVDVTEMEPQDRGIGMVFQNYALFPHMNIRKNLTFPLEIAKVKREERNKVVNEVGDLLDIRKHFKKKPEMLSGGERQRVAMGRAMVKECNLYLFDEPLSNLDDGLRTRLRPEILRQFHELKVPFVYVTHDQVDAMTMGTKVAVMQNGEIQQLGTPQEIYDTPASMFVAGFVGSPKINFMTAEVKAKEEKIYLECGDLSLELAQYEERLSSYINKKVVIGIRPEDLLTTRTGEDQKAFTCVLERYEHLGNKVHLYADLNGSMICIVAPVTVRAKVGQALKVYLDKKKVHLFDAETERRL
ncbi:MAG: ABC transporter ATP-binding protein [Bariatricus sp.]